MCQPACNQARLFAISSVSSNYSYVQKIYGKTEYTPGIVDSQNPSWETIRASDPSPSEHKPKIVRNKLSRTAFESTLHVLTPAILHTPGFYGIDPSLPVVVSAL